MRPNSKLVAPFFALWTKMNNNPDTWGHEGHNQVTVLSHLEKLKDIVTLQTLCIRRLVGSTDQTDSSGF